MAPIYHEVEQNTPEWQQLRTGIPCSSEFHKIIMPKKAKMSVQAPALLNRLLAEWWSGEPSENEYQSTWMERGHEMEAEAVSAFEFIAGVETLPGGFITTSDGMMGCSPDRLIGDSSDLELKSPLLSTQIGYALHGVISDTYKAQLQGRLMIHERESVQIFSYHPKLSIPPLTVGRDEKFIESMRAVMGEFIENMLAKRAELEKRFGKRPSQIKDRTAGEDWLGVTDEDVEVLIQHHFGQKDKP